MKDLERLDQIEKQLNAKKRENLKKGYEILGREFYKKSNAKSLSEAEKMLTKMSEYEKLGRKFYKKAQAKSMSEAEDMLQHISVFQNKESDLTADQYQQLQAIVNGMKWTGNFWQIDNLKEVSNWLSQFRKESLI